VLGHTLKKRILGIFWQNGQRNSTENKANGALRCEPAPNFDPWMFSFKTLM